MNEEQKDKGLKRAVKAENEFRLPSNFAYRTMRKVEEAIRLREKEIGTKNFVCYDSCFCILSRMLHCRISHLLW